MKNIFGVPLQGARQRTNNSSLSHLLTDMIVPRPLL